MVSATHQLLVLLREGRNNRSNPDFQTFFERGLYPTAEFLYIMINQTLPFIKKKYFYMKDFCIEEFYIWLRFFPDDKFLI